jgi:hypothetical protein
VERASPDAATHLGFIKHVSHTSKHLAGGAAGERQQQDTFGRRTLRDKPRYAMDQGRRLARAGPSDDQQRFVTVAGGITLLVVQSCEQGVQF